MTTKKMTKAQMLAVMLLNCDVKNQQSIDKAHKAISRKSRGDVEKLYNASLNDPANVGWYTSLLTGIQFGTRKPEYIAVSKDGADFIHTQDIEFAKMACNRYTAKNNITSFVKCGDKVVYSVEPNK